MLSAFKVEEAVSLVASELVTVVEKLASSPKAAANSFRVSSVAGAESTRLAIAVLTSVAALDALVAASEALVAAAVALAAAFVSEESTLAALEAALVSLVAAFVSLVAALETLKAALLSEVAAHERV